MRSWDSVGAFTNFSRKLLLQSTPGIDALVQDDLAQELALACDKAVFHGDGSDEPTGIEHTSSIGSVDGTDLGWDGIVDFETDVAAANADVGTMAYVMPATVRGLLKTRQKVANFAQFLCVVSNQIKAGNLFFGDFGQVIIGEWGILDILVDPYSGSTTGTVKVVAFQSVDVGVRQPGAFSFSSNVT
jgi:Phage capsid family